MRIFDKEKRLHTSLSTIDYFETSEYNVLAVWLD